MNRELDGLMLCGAVLIASFAPGCIAGDAFDAADTEAENAKAAENVAEATQPIVVPSGLGNYCSLVYSSGGWAVKPTGPTSDPCAEMRVTSPGGTITRAGLFSMAGLNTVIGRCGAGGGYVVTAQGYGAVTFDYAVNQALADGQGTASCTFSAAPAVLPVFDAPFTACGALSLPGCAANVSVSQGYDHALGFTIKPGLTEIGGPEDLPVVDHQGHTHTNANNHGAYDWPMSPGADIKSVADGTVIMFRDRAVPAGCGAAGTIATPQKEMWIRHTVGTGLYAEWYVTYYAHFSAFNAALLPPAQNGVSVAIPVVKGQVLGTVGTTGCSTGTHLHMNVTRLTNTASAFTVPFNILPGLGGTIPDDSTNVIDPFGWSAPGIVDPVGWMAYPRGAISSYLWNSGKAPTVGSW